MRRIGVRVMKRKVYVTDEDLLKGNVEDFEKHIIVSALLRTHGNQSLAAKQLGTTPRVIAYRIQKYAIDLEQFRSRRKKNKFTATAAESSVDNKENGRA